MNHSEGFLWAHVMVSLILVGSVLWAPVLNMLQSVLYMYMGSRVGAHSRGYRAMEGFWGTHDATFIY